MVFKLIFTSYYRPLLRYAMKFVIDIDAAEDIVQQTFLSIWEKGKTHSIDSSYKSYLFRSVHNACINHLKQDVRRKDYIKAFLLEVNRTYHVNGLTSLMDVELADEIENAVSDLPASCQHIFRLSRFDGLKNREIAMQLSISIRTVETQIYRAMKYLRERLKEYAPVIPVWLFFFKLL